MCIWLNPYCSLCNTSSCEIPCRFNNHWTVKAPLIHRNSNKYAHLNTPIHEHFDWFLSDPMFSFALRQLSAETWMCRYCEKSRKVHLSVLDITPGSCFLLFPPSEGQQWRRRRKVDVQYFGAWICGLHRGETIRGVKNFPQLIPCRKAADSYGISDGQVTENQLQLLVTSFKLNFFTNNWSIKVVDLQGKDLMC